MFKDLENTTQAPAAEENKPAYNLDVSVNRVKVLSDSCVTFALHLCNKTISLYNCKLVAYKDKTTGEAKMFISWPSVKSEKDDKYYNQAFVRLSPDAENAVITQVLTVVKAKKS